MLGILDSGEGGEVTAREIRRLSPSSDILLYLDRKNSPYGEKSEEELIPIVEAGITTLHRAGAERVLLACCTASTVHRRLSQIHREISLPIIECVAKSALRMARGEGIALLATERTVASREFDKHLGPSLTHTIPAPELVRLIDGGARDGNVDEGVREYLYRVLSPISLYAPSVIILGCTHFSSLEGTIKEVAKKLTKKKILIASSARIAAESIIASATPLCGGGRLLRL